jgi:hypothetical protein
MRGDGNTVNIRFKAAGFPCVLEISAGNEEMAGVISTVESWRTEDPHVDKIVGLQLGRAAGEGS